MNETQTNIARGAGRLAYRQGRPVHVVRQIARDQGLDVEQAVSGWYAERADVGDDQIAIGKR